jgi:hypothetical protein
VLGVAFALLALVPLAHASPPDPIWIAGIYDGDDFDEVVSMLTGNDVGPPVQLTGTVPFLAVSAPARVSVAAVAAAVILAVRPRSPPSI